jgi:hypothetical protein
MYLPTVAAQLPNNTLQLLEQYGGSSWFHVAEQMAHMQNSRDCASLKYLLVDDIVTVSGMGWSMLTILSLGLQALVGRRVMVHASSVVEGVK